MENNIVIYENDGQGVSIDVKIEAQTLWLSLAQISSLFNRDKSVISRHLTKIFKEKELDRNSVVAFFATTASDGKTYKVEHFNLDAILSVGYRVNSKQGTQFRKWSSSVLSEHILRGYSINQYNLTLEKLKDLEQAMDLMSNTLISGSVVEDIGVGVFNIIYSYIKTWSTLLKYDENSFEPTTIKGLSNLVSLEYEEVVGLIASFKLELVKKGEATQLFAHEKDNGLKGILGNIALTFDNMPLYKSNEERAAHLLYFIIKDHPFSDGNKRVGCFLFLIFLDKAGFDLVKIPNNSLIALALLIAESAPSHKDIMVKLIIKLLE